MFRQYESPPAALSRTEIFGSMVPFSSGPLGFSPSRNGPVERLIEGGAGEFVVLRELVGDSGRILHGSEFATVSELRRPASFEGLFRLFCVCAKADIEQTSEIAMRRRMPVIGASFATRIIAPPV
jgi:hypothetical protein